MSNTCALSPCVSARSKSGCVQTRSAIELNAFLSLMTAYFFLRVRVHDDDRPMSALSL